ncbi:MAG: serine/threonine-protein phosphatase [Ignavibacteriae bacterium]|nr:serine/threonine-protein phosphatase [Ignavibacteriota bacterium]
MDEYKKNYTEEPKLRNTIKEDLKTGGLFRTLKRDFKELKEFYISEEKHRRLSRMNRVKYVFVFWWWVLKSMILKLTPLRRILLIIGLIFLILPENYNLHSKGVNVSFETGYLGAAIIVFVLMLELKDKLLAHDELEAGRKIQSALMPEENPAFEGWSLMLFTRSANEVSGDLVDFVKIEPNRAGILLSDVAGKGLKAALLTTKLQATVRAFVSDFGLSELVSKVNNIFYRDSLRNIFASMIFFEIEENTSQIKYINAGHLPPLIVSENGISELEKGDMALGLMNGSSYSEKVIEMKNGEFLFAYSDGLTEARDEKGFFYGSERLMSKLKDLKKYSAREIGNSIINDVDKFIGDNNFSDDLSLLIIKKV